MKNKALKQYIEEKYNVKIKKARIWGLFGTPLITSYFVIAERDNFGYCWDGWSLKSQKLFLNLTEILDFLKEISND